MIHNRDIQKAERLLSLPDLSPQETQWLLQFSQKAGAWVTEKHFDGLSLAALNHPIRLVKRQIAQNMVSWLEKPSGNMSFLLWIKDHVQEIIESLDLDLDLRDLIADFEARHQVDVTKIIREFEIKQALGCLSKEQENLVILRFFYGCSLEETASILGLSIQVLRGRLEKALKTLRNYHEK